MINKTYIINLETCLDKKIHMQKEFDKLLSVGTNLHHEFFSAIDGDDPNVLKNFNVVIPQWFDPNSGKAITKGEIGCALSHYTIWKKIVDQVEDGTLPATCNVLILEDDVIFTDNFLHKFNQYLSETTEKYDLLYLHRKPLCLEIETKVSLHINRAKRSYWACAYIVTYEGAKKLVNTNYLQNLVPADEYLPIMYGTTAFGFEKIFESYDKLTCFAVSPSLLKLTPDAFLKSKTFHSDAYVDKNEYTFDTNKEFKLLYIGPTIGNSFERFKEHTKVYAIPNFCIQNDGSTTDVKLLHNYLKEYKSTKLQSTLFMVVSVKPKTYCNLLPVSSPIDIVNKVKNLSTDSKKIIVSVSDKELNCTLFCAWGDSIMVLLKDFIQKSGKFKKDHVPASTSINSFSLDVALTINLLKNSNQIVDEKSTIFQVLSEFDQIGFDHGKSKVYNKKHNTNPSIVAATNNAVLALHKVENYAGNGWNEYYGYTQPKSNYEPIHKVYFSVNLCQNSHVLDILEKINYPKDLLRIVVNKVKSCSQDCSLENVTFVTYNSEEELRVQDLLKFSQSDCDYYFFVDKNCILTNADILQKLISLDKKVVAPLLRRGSEAWCNFWGSLSKTGYYERSFDYFDIIEEKRKSCWNVPYITSTFLLKKEVVQKIPGLYTDNNNWDLDMRFCYNLRNSDIFMYVSNLEKYGFLAEEPAATIAIVPQKTIENITLEDITTHKDLWEKKYLHADYFDNKNNISKLNCVELCNDIYSFPLFSETFCEDVIARAELYGKWSKGKGNHHDPRLGKGYYENVPTVDVQLFELGLDKQWNNIVFTYIAPVTRHLYNNYKTKDVNLAFVVRYKPDEQSSLAPHHDASTYTVNIALNRGAGVDYDGGGCKFIRHNYVLKNQEPGRACIHPGRLTAYHEGLSVTSGTRYILVSFIN